MEVICLLNSEMALDCDGLFRHGSGRTVEHDVLSLKLRSFKVLLDFMSSFWVRLNGAGRSSLSSGLCVFRA